MLRIKIWNLLQKNVWMLSQENGKALCSYKGNCPISFSASCWQMPATFCSTYRIKGIRGHSVSTAKAFQKKREECGSFPGFWLLSFPAKYFLKHCVCKLLLLFWLAYYKYPSSLYKEIGVHCRDDICCFRSGECYKFHLLMLSSSVQPAINQDFTELVAVFRVKKDQRQI